MNEQFFLLTIHVPPLLEEDIVDCLLAINNSEGFSSQAVDAHTCDHEGLTLAEQVAGRQRQLRFQMAVPEQQLRILIKRLKLDFSGAGLHYWVVPILETGII